MSPEDMRHLSLSLSLSLSLPHSLTIPHTHSLCRGEMSPEEMRHLEKLEKDAMARADEVCHTQIKSDQTIRPNQIKPSEREFFIDNLLVRIHVIIVMIRWTGLAPWRRTIASQNCAVVPRRARI